MLACVDHFQRKGLFKDFQSGFRVHCTPLVKVKNDLFKASDSGLISMRDLTVDSILLATIFCYRHYMVRL